MIIKSLSRKTKSYKQLLNYMFKEASNGIVLKKNIQGNTIEDWVQEFNNNENNRLFVRSNNLMFYHEVISVSKKDKENITITKLKDIGKQYLKLRGDNIMSIGVIHEEKDNIHLHFIISSVEIYTGRSARTSKGKFKEIKEELQKYHIDKYPELVHSVVNHSKKSKSISEKEFQLIKRTKHATEKEYINTILGKLYSQSKSKKEFLKLILNNNLNIYERNGKPCGIITNKKYRFKTIGFDEDKLKALDVQKDFESIRDLGKNQNELEHNTR